MDAVIKLTPDELTEEFFKKLKTLAASAKRIEIRVDGVDAYNNLSAEEISKRLEKIEQNKVISFTRQELEAYINKIAG